MDKKKLEQKTTKYGVAFVDGKSKFPFAIVDDYVGSMFIPVWLKSWRFQHEYEALMIMYMWINYSIAAKEKADQSEFQKLIVKGALRLMGSNSEWAN